MKVSELIAELQKMPQDANVVHVWDGGARSVINHVWLSKAGYVVTIDCDEYVYDDEDRPVWSQSEDDNVYWKSPPSRKRV